MAPKVSDRTWLVALAASFWGLSALWRGPLAKEYPALAVVFWEHLVLTVLTLWWLLPALRRLAGASRRTKAGVLVIGAGSSALATVMFTAAFGLGDPITPQVLQKLQPLIAIALAAVLLGERLRRSYLWFAVPALVVVVARRDRTLLKRSFPFGPFMVLGTLVGLVWGTPLARLMWG